MSVNSSQSSSQVSTMEASAANSVMDDRDSISSITSRFESLDTPERPPRRRRFSQVEPTTPPLTEAVMQRLLRQMLQPIEKSLAEIKESQVQRTEEVEHLYSTINELRIEQSEMQQKLEQENSILKKRLEKIETQSRRENLRLYGLGERPEERVEERVIEFFGQKGFYFDSRTFERVHRLGPKRDGFTRPIIMKFAHYKDRDDVWRDLGHGLFPPSFSTKHVREDFPEEVDKNRMKLLSVAKAVLSTPLPPRQRHPLIKLIADRLLIGRDSYTVETLHRLPKHLTLSNIKTPRTDSKVAFFTSCSPLSNHFLSPFKYKGESFNCMEQYMMVDKARFCNDQEAVVKVMREKDPVKQKHLEKELRNFKKDDWQSKVEERILPALVEKFDQCQVSKDMLLGTEDRAIYEANPHDLFFGIGLPLHSKDLWDSSQHKGKNMMGKMLETARFRLKQM